MLAEGDAFGRATRMRGERVMVEFVSANPTGPLHVGHGRQAALGDAIAHAARVAGLRASRASSTTTTPAQQIQNLAVSVRARAQGDRSASAATFPEDGYRGEYIRELAQRYLAEVGHDLSDIEAIRRFAVAELRKEQDRDLQAFGVQLRQLLPRELALHRRPRRRAPCARLVASGTTYEHDGALWLRTTDYGDDKDRVMRKSDGGYTYFVPDVAYHVTKWERGFAQGDQRAGLRPPQHGHARARRPAGARAWASRRAIRTTCCTRW